MPFTKIDFSITRAPGDSYVDVCKVGIFDADGDSDLDLMVWSFIPFGAEDRATPVFLMLNDGSGGFSDGTSAFFPNAIPKGVQPHHTKLADFNGDGRPDIFVADAGLDGYPWPGAQNMLFLSSGAHGLVNATINLPVVFDFTHSVAPGDLDGDGDIDIVVMNIGDVLLNRPLPTPQTDHTAYFLFNDGFGHFTRVYGLLPPDVQPLPIPGRITGTDHLTSLLFDADGDGDLDLFLGSGGADARNLPSWVLFNDGSGNFFNSERTRIPDGPFGQLPKVHDADPVDLNADGFLDLVLTINDNYVNNAGYIQVLINDGTGRFTDDTAARLPLGIDSDGASTGTVDVVDFNGDGFMDLVAMHFQFPPIFLNDGTGHFIRLPHSQFDTSGMGNTPDIYRWMPMDANGDGRMDILALNHANPDERFRVFIQQDPGPSIAGSAGADGLWGDSDAETISGLDGDDVLFGGAGGDSLRGGDGNDTLVGGTGNDTLEGGIGDDIYVIADADTIVDPAGTDTVRSSITYTLPANVENLVLTGTAHINGTGTAFDNVITGNTGNNLLDGNGGIDILNGGAGDDTYILRSVSQILIDPSGLDEVITYVESHTLLGDFEVLRIGSGLDIVAGYGNAVDNFLHANEFGNELYGQGGNDRLFGNVGDDRLEGGVGFDTLYGGGGADVLFGQEDNDHLEGEAGADLLFGQGGDDVLIGGTGADQVWGDIGADLLAGGGEDDVLLGELGDDQLYGGAGADLLFGQGGVDLLLGEEGDDRLWGDIGADLLFGQDGADILLGEQDDDRLWGGFGADLLFGQGGADILLGEQDDDRLWGDVGADLLFGQDGADVLLGEDDDDRLWGGNGADLLAGQGGNDELLGEEDNDRLFGGIGADLLAGQGGNDELQGEDGNDRLFGGAGADLLFGQAGDDELQGEQDNDRLWGGAGADVLWGQGGNDELYGEADADRFMFTQGGGADTVVDFQDGIDLLDLRAYAGATFANTTIAVQGANTLITFTGAETALLIGINPASISGADFLFAA